MRLRRKATECSVAFLFAMKGYAFINLSRLMRKWYSAKF